MLIPLQLTAASALLLAVVLHFVLHLYLLLVMALGTLLWHAGASASKPSFSHAFVAAALVLFQRSQHTWVTGVGA
jgi:uncharacterized membrane protein